MAELIKKQPSLVHAPSREQAATDSLVSDSLVSDLLGPDEPEGSRREPNRVARAAGLVTGALMLFASVVTVSVMASSRPSGPQMPYVQPPLEISGSSALRPDLLAAQLPGETTLEQVVPAPTRQTAPSAPVKEMSAPQLDVAPPSVSTGPQPRIDVVRKFYALLPRSPGTASKLLSFDLVGADPHEFVRSWSLVRAVNVDGASLRPDGSVLAVVSIQERDGSWLRLEQVFRLTDTSTPRIIGTEIVSAQRS